MKDKALEQSRALWNRSGLDLQSDEMLAQLLDRGDIGDWRKLYSMAKTDDHLRVRIKRIVTSLPVSLPHFWLAALATLGESIDWHAAVPNYFESSSV